MVALVLFRIFNLSKGIWTDLLQDVDDEEHVEHNSASSCSQYFHENMGRMDLPNMNASMHEETPVQSDLNLTSSFMAMIGQLESKSNLTHANIQMIVDGMSTFLEDISEFITQRVKTLLCQIQVDNNDSAAKSCLDDFANLPDILQPVNTKYKRTQYLEECNAVINPEQIVLGTRLQLRYSSVLGCDVLTAVEDTMQFIPIDQLLGAILLNRNYRQIMLDFAASLKQQNNGVIRHYFHTDSFKQHPFFKKYSDGLAINLYVDAFETTNVLGSHTGIHKLEGMYMTLQNFPPEYQSQLTSVFLVALWYGQDVKTYGYDKILEPVVNCLMRLESGSGSEVVIGEQHITVRACLVFMSADNLGYNSLFGFSESFSVMRYCRFCENTRDEVDTIFVESGLKLRRSTKSYSEAVERVGTPDYDQQATGIKRGCLLNNLQYWHVTENFVVDVLHDVLQGVAVAELSLVFDALSADNQCKLTIHAMNAAINSFNYSLADKNSRPPTFYSLSALRMSASEMWCFLRNLPLLIGHLIPREQEHWNLVKMLLDITDIVLAPEVTPNLSSYLVHLVEEHHEYFKKLFPDKKITPKQQFLVHYAKCLVMSGPPVRYWTMRFEARHQIFKDFAKNTNCFKNVCKPLANRFQRAIAFRFLNPVMYKCNEIGPAQEMQVRDFLDPVCDVLCKTTGVCRSDTVLVLKWVKLGHYTFKPSAVTVNAIEGGLPQFGKVTDIIAINEDVFFVEELLLTSHYDDHFHAYSVSHPPQPRRVCVPLKSLLDHIPLQFHVIKYEEELHMLINLRYIILQEEQGVSSDSSISVTSSKQ
jgi:hypothetical protein